MKRSSIIALTVCLVIVGVSMLYFNAGGLDSSGPKSGYIGNIGSGLATNGTTIEEIPDNLDGNKDEDNSYREPLDVDELYRVYDDQIIEVIEPLTSVDTGLEVKIEDYGYSLDTGKDKIKWYLKSSNGKLLKNKIPVKTLKVKQMFDTVSRNIKKRFPGEGSYIDYPIEENEDGQITKRIRKKSLIKTLTLLERMWESHGGDGYGINYDTNGDPVKIFTPDFSFEQDQETGIEIREINDDDDDDKDISKFNYIQDLFIDTAHADIHDDYEIPFEIFDKTWGNTNLFGFRGQMDGMISLWGNAGAMSIKSKNLLNLDLSIYIFGIRKKFMAGNINLFGSCVLGYGSNFDREIDVSKWGANIYSNFNKTKGVCREDGTGTGVNLDVRGRKISFEGFDACMRWSVFPGLKVRGCAGVKGSSDIVYLFQGKGALNQASISSKQRMPYYGRAELAVSPLGFDLASLSFNVSGEILDLSHQLDIDIFTYLGVQDDSQKADLKITQKILGGRVYLKIKWWSVTKWGYKTWIKEIKPNGYVRNQHFTEDLLRR
ncbi:MAG: hypothetical protein HOJ35_05615 [Bdellovibrionales bacterium]|jgi:hypothetical protein|nr:hypothetical protein [Bdellovibrionales bacterium]